MAGTWWFLWPTDLTSSGLSRFSRLFDCSIAIRGTHFTDYGTQTIQYVNRYTASFNNVVFSRRMLAQYVLPACSVFGQTHNDGGIRNADFSDGAIIGNCCRLFFSSSPFSFGQESVFAHVTCEARPRSSPNFHGIRQ